MSYNNRNMKRDNYGNRSNFNRNASGGVSGRLGNMGGGMGGGGGGGGGGGVSPWEGGMMPGGRGILPTPGNSLSLGSTQAQLAIASNLLSNILRNQQDTQPQVPSLLSLGNNFGNSAPHFSNQQSYSQGNFNDRMNRQPSIKNRLQPYNKMGNRARDGVAGRRVPQNRSQSGSQRQGGNQRNDKSSKANTASKQNQGNRKESQDKTNDKSNEKFNENTEESVALSEENEDTEESRKRDWKSEKKSDDSFSNNKHHETVKTEDEAEEKDEGDKSNTKKSVARHAESRYKEVPISNMYCHVCKKHMWDGSSFENHLRGRAHQLMMDKLDESYKLKVELMRHELRVAEEQRELTLTNSKRRGKKLSIDMSVREYCTMCDLHFYGTLSSHRKSEKHQQLKTFLHPRCFACSKEFPSRIDYDEHCLTPSHMKNHVLSEEQKKNKRKEKLLKGESESRTTEDEEKDVGLEKNDKSDDSIVDSTDFVTEIPEEPIDLNLKVPPYKQVKTNQLSIGKSMVKEVTGYHCEKCRRFMLTEEDMLAHLQSNAHYRSFVQEIKHLRAAVEKSAKEEKEAKLKTKEGNENDSEEKLEPSPKRAKLDDDVEEKDVPVKEEEEDEEKEKDNENDNDNDNDNENDNDNDNDKYDPEEANDESEDESPENVKNADNDENDENQDVPNDNESTGISINDNEDLLEVNEEEDDEEEEEEKEKEAKKRETRPKTVSTPRNTNSQSNRGAYSQRARGNRARRSRR